MVWAPHILQPVAWAVRQLQASAQPGMTAGTEALSRPAAVPVAWVVEARVVPAASAAAAAISLNQALWLGAVRAVAVPAAVRMALMKHLSAITARLVAARAAGQPAREAPLRPAVLLAQTAVAGAAVAPQLPAQTFQEAAPQVAPVLNGTRRMLPAVAVAVQAIREEVAKVATPVTAVSTAGAVRAQDTPMATHPAPLAQVRKVS